MSVFRKFYRRYKTLFRAKQNEDLWPIMKYFSENPPHFLFILTPPYSGSTAISQILITSHRCMVLRSNGEGQWLIPGLCDSDRWDPKKPLSIESIKSVWLHTYQSVFELTSNIDIVIEKSPPNLVRIEKLISVFPNHSLLANNRNPYANVSSILFRNHKTEKYSKTKRLEVIEKIAKDWVWRSSLIKSNVKKLKIPLVTYEQFCDNPERLASVL